MAAARRLAWRSLEAGLVAERLASGAAAGAATGVVRAAGGPSAVRACVAPGASTSWRGVTGMGGAALAAAGRHGLAGNAIGAAAGLRRVSRKEMERGRAGGEQEKGGGATWRTPLQCPVPRGGLDSLFPTALPRIRTSDELRS
jgi:hypothetical protein